MNPTDTMLTVHNADLRPWHVRLVRPGDAYGLGDKLTHTSSGHHRPAGDPLVEFYDAAQDPVRFGPRGQFVARYYASTLLDDERELTAAGLCLNTDSPSWSLDGPAMLQVTRWLRALDVQPGDSDR